jgi:hypothetical protein
MIPYDQAGTFVNIPPDVVFDDIIDGTVPVTAADKLQKQCADWCSENLYGHYGIFRMRYRTYGLWFELVSDATLFKMRWFCPPEN